MITTADQYRKLAADCRAERERSFEQSDTDGFLSQRASDIMALRYERAAEILEAGNTALFNGLYEGERRVAARVIQGQFGDSWLLDDAEAAKFGRKFVPMGNTSRVQKQLGLSQRKETAPAAISIRTGDVYRTGCKWGSDAIKQGA